MKKLPKIFFTLCLLLSAFGGEGQIITPFAGFGSDSDGNPAISASIYDPTAIAYDHYGNLYFAQTLGHKIRKVDTGGIITTIASTGNPGFSGDSGLATLAKLNQPEGIAIDAFGNIYFADINNNRIRKVEISTGIITTIAGNGNPGFSGDSGLAINASLNRPVSICFDKDGNLYIGDNLNFRIRKINTAGIITTYAGNGIFAYSGDGQAAINVPCVPNLCICMDDSGNLYIGGVSVIRKMNTAGIITTIVGDTSAYIYNGDGISALSAHLEPEFLAFNDSGQLFIADVYNDRIRKVNTAGTIYTIVGNGVATNTGDNGLAESATIAEPSGIAFDHCGNLYIANVNGPHIRKVTFNPSCPDTTTSTNNVATHSSIHIYPNPCSNQFTVTYPAALSQNTRAALYSITGQLVYSTLLKETNTLISTASLAPGIYICKIIAEGQEVITKKILVE